MCWGQSHRTLMPCWRRFEPPLWLKVLPKVPFIVCGAGGHMCMCVKKKVFFRESENHEKPATFRQKSAIFWALCALKRKKIPRAQRAAKNSTQKTFTTCRQNARFSLEFFWVTLTFFFQNGGEYFMENHRLWCKTFNNNSGQEQRET